MITSIDEKLSYNELIGLKAAVISSSNTLHVGIKGIVVDETKNMLVIATDSGKKYLPKENILCEFTLRNGRVIEIEGRQLLGKHADRIGRF